MPNLDLSCLGGFSFAIIVARKGGFGTDFRVPLLKHVFPRASFPGSLLHLEHFNRFAHWQDLYVHHLENYE
jgi:hypothetical protein